jgi:hypothetical protein
LGALAESAPAAAAVPETGTVSRELGAVLVMDRLKLALPADFGANTTLNGALCPACRVMGKFRPVKLYPAPLNEACETVTLEPPELLRVAGSVWLLPVWTDPKLTLDGATVSAPGRTAVTASGTARVGLEASELIVRLPLKLPDVGGVEFRFRLALCPAANVMGVAIPLKLKPVPVTAAPLMVTLEPPILVTVAVCFWVLPTCTMPKTTGLEPTPSIPAVETEADNPRLRVEFEAVLAIASAALAFPGDWAANATVKLEL